MQVHAVAAAANAYVGINGVGCQAEDQFKVAANLRQRKNAR